MFKIYIGTQTQVLGRELTNKEVKEFIELVKKSELERDVLNTLLTKKRLPKEIKFEILLGWTDIVNTYKKKAKKKTLDKRDYQKLIRIILSAIEKFKK